ncbi:C25 family cysteine peptidase [Calditrichota bacterium GD2]
MRFFYLFFLFIFSASLLARDYQIDYQKIASDAHQLTFTLFNYEIKIVDEDGSVFSDLDFSSSVKLEQKGYAALPFVHATLQLPPLKNMDLHIEAVETEEIQLRYPMLPSRGVIYRNQDPDTIPYWIDPASITDSWYPEAFVRQSRPFILKDVRGATVYFYPFQYNAATKTLKVFKSIKITLTENDSNPINPLIRMPGYKILPEMDGIYQTAFLNYTRTTQDLDYGQHGDILVISTDRDTAAVAPYIAWKREKGFNVALEVVPKGTNVKSLIQQKYDENNNLLYVLLIGDYDDVQSDKGTSENGPMDPQLGCVVGDDYYADISVGRLSANSPADVTVQVNKIIEYEKNPDAGMDWYKSALGIGSAEGSGSGDDGEVDKDHIQNIWDNKLDPFTYDIYSTAYDPGATDAMVANAVNDGVSIINYCGHGSMTSWGTTGFNNDDVNNLTNGDMLPFIFSVACVNGAFDDGDCFAEAWLQKDNGGAVMFLGSTINQPWAPPMRGQDYFNDILIGGYNYDDHPGQNGINTHEQRTFIGSIVINGFALMLNESNSSSDVETVQTWCTFGDPALQVRTQAPADVTLSNENIEAGTPFSTTVTSGGQPVADAMVCISQNGMYYSALTDANGQVTIEHTFEQDSALLVVTAFNKQTVYKMIPVSGGQGPNIVVDSYQINDQSTGNNNAQVEYKEQFYLDVAAKNIGNEPGIDVDAQLSSNDTYIQIQDNSHFYGTIDTSAVVPGPQAFLLQAADGTPDQHTVNCTVTFSDTSTRQWTSDISFVVNAPDLGNGSLTIYDGAQGDGDGILDAGETADMSIPLFNQGHAASESGKATLTTNSPYLTIHTDSVAIAPLAVQDTVACVFSVSAASDAPEGEVAELYFNAVCGAYASVDTFKINIGGKAVYLMQDGTFEVTDGYFYDSGGKDGNYGTSENSTLTFLPADRAAVKVVFHSFSTIANYDKLYIYDGPDDTYPQVPGSPFSGDQNPGEIEATNDAGALTFHFVSNPILGGTGWEADVFTTGVSAARERSMAINDFRLLNNYPNPFNPSTTIRFQIPRQTEVQILIFNLLGQKVKTLFEGKRGAGIHQLSWDGHDDAGQAVSSGIYIVQARAGQHVARQKILLVK